MDALSDVLRVVGLTGGVFMEAELTAPWRIAGRMSPEYCSPFMTPPPLVIAFHYVTEGRFSIEFEDGTAGEVRAGEVILLPRNDLHFFGSGGTAPTIEAGTLIQPPQEFGVAKMLYLGGGGERTRMVCGFLGGSMQLHPLLANLPPIIVLPLAELPSGEWMARTFSYAAQTLADGDPGAGAVMARMSELLFVEAVRRHLATLPPERTGWLAGLKDPAIGRALSLMHARLNEDWTADALAHEVNMSRSAFAERFTTLIGVPPMRYLTSWRIQVAAQKLRETRLTIAQIAYEVGYESEAAFTRAFRREVGAPPATWRRGDQRVASASD